MSKKLIIILAALTALMLAMPALGIDITKEDGWESDPLPENSGHYPLAWQIADQREGYLVPGLGNLTSLPIMSSWDTLNSTLGEAKEEYLQIKAIYSGNDSEARALANALGNRGLRKLIAICKWQDYKLPTRESDLWTPNTVLPANIADNGWMMAAIVTDGYDSVLVQISPELATKEIVRWSVIVDPTTKNQVVSGLSIDDAIGIIDYSEMTRIGGPKQMGLFYI